MHRELSAVRHRVDSDSDGDSDCHKATASDGSQGWVLFLKSVGSWSTGAD